jgi:hypothetical protein
VAPLDGALVVPSFDVATENADAEYVPAPPLVIARVSVAAVEAASAQVLTPLFERLMMTTFVSVGSDPLALQVVGNVVGATSVTTGVVVRVVKPLGRVMTI